MYHWKREIILNSNILLESDYIKHEICVIPAISDFCYKWNWADCEECYWILLYVKKEVRTSEGCRVLSLSQYLREGGLNSWEMLSNMRAPLQAQILGKKHFLLIRKVILSSKRCKSLRTVLVKERCFWEELGQ